MDTDGTECTRLKCEYAEWYHEGHLQWTGHTTVHGGLLSVLSSDVATVAVQADSRTSPVGGATGDATATIRVREDGDAVLALKDGEEGGVLQWSNPFLRKDPYLVQHAITKRTLTGITDYQTYKEMCVDEPSSGHCGQATATSEISVSNSAAQAFDADPGTVWDGAPVGWPNQWLSYDLGEERPVVLYTIASTANECPSSWTFEGADPAVTCTQPFPGTTSCSNPGCVFTAAPNGGAQGRCDSWVVLDTQAARGCDTVAEKQCTAKTGLAPNHCGQPAPNALACPDNLADCIFTPDPTPGGVQGTCAPATQADCDAALLADADADGSECATAKCTYEEPTIYHVPTRSCSAKDPSSITCGQPANSATACPDNVGDCVFTADPLGGTQGSCALTSQADCTAALAVDTDGTRCRELKCEYEAPGVRSFRHYRFQFTAGVDLSGTCAAINTASATDVSFCGNAALNDGTVATCENAGTGSQCTFTGSANGYKVAQVRLEDDKGNANGCGVRLPDDETCTVGRSCADISIQDSLAGDGEYIIDPDGTGPVLPLLVYCDIEVGSAWTLFYSFSLEDETLHG